MQGRHGKAGKKEREGRERDSENEKGSERESERVKRKRERQVLGKEALYGTDNHLDFCFGLLKYV